MARRPMADPSRARRPHSTPPSASRRASRVPRRRSNPPDARLTPHAARRDSRIRPRPIVSLSTRPPPRRPRARVRGVRARVRRRRGRVRPPQRVPPQRDHGQDREAQAQEGKHPGRVREELVRSRADDGGEGWRFHDRRGTPLARAAAPPRASTAVERVRAEVRAGGGRGRRGQPGDARRRYEPGERVWVAVAPRERVQDAVESTRGAVDDARDHEHGHSTVVRGAERERDAGE